MLKNAKCDACKLGKICKVKSKLKPFTEDAKVDLGVNLTFVDCDNFAEEDNVLLDEADENEDEEE